VPEWQVQISKDGQQKWLNLETSNRDVAAKKARDAWVKLQAEGWDSLKAPRPPASDLSVGDYLAAVQAEADLAPVTLAIYASKFRRMVAGVTGMSAENERHDYVHGGNSRWRQRVHAVKLNRLTPEAVNRWKIQYLTTNAANPIQARRARRTIASILRSSKALFAPKVVGALSINLPSPLPLASVEIPRVSTPRYISKIDYATLYRDALVELESPSEEILTKAVFDRFGLGPEGKTQRDIPREIAAERRMRAMMFRAFCLALFVGLRRDEIDTLLWQQIDFQHHFVRIETNEFTQAESDGSEAAIDIGEALTAKLQSWRDASSSEFVIELGTKPRPQVASYHHYRANRVFKRLHEWLRQHGVEDRNALHTLRKEFGTEINRRHGLFAASAALRHSSIQLTRAVYVAKKTRTAFELPEAASSQQSPHEARKNYRDSGSHS
jgi:integrase